MKIQVRRTGGFIGAPLNAELDTERLHPNDVSIVNELLQTIEQSKSAAPPMPDAFTYNIQMGDTNATVHEGSSGAHAAAQLVALAQTQTPPASAEKGRP